MSAPLISGYHSDSDNEDGASASTDVFGLSKIQSVKKQRTEEAVVPEAAPHVLAEVS